MILHALKLSQPTVFACITFLLLTVMNLEQAWCLNEQIVVLYHKNTNKVLTMHPNGSVTTEFQSTSFNEYECLAFNTVGLGLISECRDKNCQKDYILQIYNYKTERYLCINKKGRVVGRKNFTSDCKFRESYIKEKNGYMEFQSTQTLSNEQNLHYYLSFNKVGKPRKALNDKHGTTHFIKLINAPACQKYRDQNNKTKLINETTFQDNAITTRHPLRHRNRRKNMKKKKRPFEDPLNKKFTHQ